MAKNHKNSMVIDEKGVRYFDEDGYELKNPDDIKEWDRRNRGIDKQKWLKEQTLYDYKLSRWGQEAVNILQENGQMKNVDIMDELRKRGHNGTQENISKFFTSKDGQRFRKEQLIKRFKGYWSLKQPKEKFKAVSIPIMITNQMRISLSALGYTQEEMRQLTPIECHEIINKGVPKKPSRERGRNQ